MSKRKNRRKERESREDRQYDSMGMQNPLRELRHEAKLSIVGVLFIGISVILMLSSYGQAGPVGDIVFSGLSKLFGWGYYLIPLVLTCTSIGFFFGETARLLGNTLIGSVFFLLSALGLLDIIYNGQGGILGKAFGSLNYLFGYSASIILNITILVASILLAFNVPLRLHWMRDIFKKGDPTSLKLRRAEGSEFTEDELKEMELKEAEARVATLKNRNNPFTLRPG